MKQTIYGDEARKAFLQAANELCDPVKITLGPKGKNVIISPLHGMAYSTKDGVTVAGEVENENPFINAGIKIIRQAARKTVEDAGDGTTTATILAHSLINLIDKALQSGVSVFHIKNNLESELQFCRDAIKKYAYPLIKDGVLNVEKLRQIATISANNDEKIGQLFADAYNVIGSTGIILLEESKKSETYIEAVRGMKQDRGYVSPYFATLPEKCDYESPVYFVTDKNITQQKDLQKIVGYCHSTKIPLIIFCADINGEALGFLNINKINNQLMVCAITIPGWVKNNKEILRDIAIYTGATFCSEDNGFNIDNIPEGKILPLFGTSKKFTSSPKECIIVDGDGEDGEIVKRIAEIEAKITPEISEWDKEQFLARKSKLNGGVAILHAGGTTEVERKETLTRCEDAILAVRSALEEGYVPGGGRIYLICAYLLHQSILAQALRSITTQICENAGLSSTDIIKQLELSNDPNFGYNAKTDELEDLCEAGVVDSAKVIRVALENAVSIALAFLNTDCLIAEFKE